MCTVDPDATTRGAIVLAMNALGMAVPSLCVDTVDDHVGCSLPEVSMIQFNEFELKLEPL